MRNRLCRKRNQYVKEFARSIPNNYPDKKRLIRAVTQNLDDFWQNMRVLLSIRQSKNSDTRQKLRPRLWKNFPVQILPFRCDNENGYKLSRLQPSFYACGRYARSSLFLGLYCSSPDFCQVHLLQLLHLFNTKT